jgi:diguanylate cyclase (GGDEF)-like protein
VARYGGEEFLIVFPETDVNNSQLVAERIRQLISEKTFKYLKDEIRVTASFGIHGFNPCTPVEKKSAELLMNQADRHLYKAKNEGRNRVETGACPSHL